MRVFEGRARDPSWLAELCDQRAHANTPRHPFSFRTGCTEWSAAVGSDVVAVARGPSIYGALPLDSDARALVLTVLCYESNARPVSLRALHTWLRSFAVPSAQCPKCGGSGWFQCPACDGSGDDCCGMCRLCVGHGMPPGRVQCLRCEAEPICLPAQLGDTTINAVSLLAGLAGFLSREIDVLSILEGDGMLIVARGDVRVALRSVVGKPVATYPLIRQAGAAPKLRR